MNLNFSVPCLFGLEGLCADELKRLDMNDVRAENGRVLFSGGAGDIAKANINLRTGEAQLYFRQHTGLRVDTAHIRFEDGARGVYVLENGVVRFRTIDPIYEEDAFILSGQPDPFDTSALRQFDQIITKGTDLEDGKVIE